MNFPVYLVIDLAVVGLPAAYYYFRAKRPLPDDRPRGRRVASACAELVFSYLLAVAVVIATGISPLLVFALTVPVYFLQRRRTTALGLTLAARLLAARRVAPLPSQGAHPAPGPHPSHPLSLTLTSNGD